MTKLHFAELQGDGIHLDNYPWCGQANANRTNDSSAVDCKRCLRLLVEAGGYAVSERESADT